MTYVFDIDGTICSNTDGKYSNATPNIDRINIINKLFNEGNKIIFFTARGMKTYDGNILKVYHVYYNFTIEQLNSWGVKYNQLVLGKPSADYYIDDKGINDENFFTTKICI